VTSTTNFGTDFGVRDGYARAMKRVASRAVVLGTLLGLALAVSACTVGGGSGLADGTLRVVGCNASNSLASGAPFSLKPTFFAGEPYEDVCPPQLQCTGPHTNRVVIRMQRNGNGVEVNDTLYFDVLNSYEVARCIRGRIKPDGQADWDPRLVTAPDGTTVPGLSWCDWNWMDPTDGGTDAAVADAGAADAGAADAGAPDAAVPTLMAAPHARINISTQDYVRASLAPSYTCAEALLVAVALPGSWIEFEDFGSAIESNADAGARSTVGDDFKVNFGERLRASRFHLVLGDEHVEMAAMSHQATPPTMIDGELDGWFDFDMERGRAAQPFP
jgi:hypothetical protein